MRFHRFNQEDFMSNRLFSLSAACIALLSLAPLINAQGGRGAITGLITDPAGAVIPNVEVVATELSTNVTFKAVTTSVGMYRIPYLPPGKYRVAAEMKGFKKAVVEPVEVATASVVTADLRLDVGAVSESVTVSAEPTRLESSSSELGYTASPQDYQNWPVSSDNDGQRQIQDFIYSALPGTTGDSYSGSINGSPTMTQEVYIEGISIGRMDIAADTDEFEPSVDAIGEFRLQTGATNAAYGGGLTAVANFSVKSGTNQLHGTAYDYVINNVFNANGYTNNAYGSPTAPYKQNSFGVAAGGPLVAPKIYNGRNKSFWFFSYEGDRRRTGQLSGFRSLPLPAFKTGDFSALSQAIYDPQSTVQLGNGTYSRTPFPGNKIPASSISKVSQNILTMAPIPNPMLPGLYNNEPGISNQPLFNLNTFTGKFDENITDKQKLTFFMNRSDRFRYNGAGKAYLPVPGSASGAFAGQDVTGTMVRLGYEYSIGPTLLNHLALGYNNFANSNSSLTLGQDWPSKIGLTGVAQTTFPQIAFTGSAAQGGTLTQLGRSNAGVEPNGSYIVADDVTWIHGSHSFKFGTEIRAYYYFQDYRGNTSGTFTFSPNQTADPNNMSSTGYSFASFLLGSVYGTSKAIDVANPHTRENTPAFYAADDWKVTRRLTLNLGLRWDIAGAMYETHGWASNLGPTTPNPGADGYPGALVFLSQVNRKAFQNSYYGEIGPRAGFAYALSDKLVLRAGYGINYTPPIMNGWGPATIDGYSGTQNLTHQTFNPVLNWDNGYPAYTKSLPSVDPTLDNGSSIAYISPNSSKQPYAQNFTIGVQYVLNNSTTIMANYVGDRGKRLNAGNFVNMNQLNPKYLSLGDALLDDISLHPNIPMPYPSFSGTVAQALLPFPQYAAGGVYQWAAHVGQSNYNAAQVVYTRRSSKGLSFLASYSFQKTLSNTDGAIYYGGASQDVYNRGLEKSVASFDHTQVLRLTWIYELPAGKGKRFLNRGGILNQVLGGWNIAANQSYQSGDPLSIYSSISQNGNYLFNGTVRPDVVLGQPLTLPQSGSLNIAAGGAGITYLNPQAFVNPPATANGVVTALGTAPRVFGNLRGPSQSNENISLFKRFSLGGENRYLELRGDAFNAFNRVGLGDPDTTVGDTYFGQILGVQHGPREVQVAARITF
jgi:hypothetical protein